MASLLTVCIDDWQWQGDWPTDFLVVNWLTDESADLQASLPIEEHIARLSS